MAEHLWEVIRNLRYPPKEVAVKQEWVDAFAIGGKRVKIVKRALPDNKNKIAGYTSYACFFYSKADADAYYFSIADEREEQKRKIELQEKQRQMIENYPLLEAENKHLRKKLLTVIDFALEECCDNLCSGYVDADDNIKVDKCRFHKLFNGTPGCELERMKKELEEKEQ